MSVQAMSWVLDHSESELASRLVLLAIANHCDAEGRNSYPAQASIAAEAHVSERTVRRCIDTLVEAGELTVKAHQGMTTGRGRTHYYELPKFIASLPADDKLSGFDTRTDRPETRTPEAQTRTPVSDEPSLEPSTEPSYLSRADRFAAAWEHYPRKLNRKGALKAWTAQVRKGVDPDDLHQATLNYARIRHGLDPATTMHGSTFYGPNDRWEDYLNPTADTAPTPCPTESPSASKSRRALEALARVNGSAAKELTR